MRNSGIENSPPSKGESSEWPRVLMPVNGTGWLKRYNINLSSSEDDEKSDEEIDVRLSGCEQVKRISLKLPLAKYKRNIFYRDFKTGSRYSGTWSKIGMDGQGTYTLPNGVDYVGQMTDGEFHGMGSLIYPRGQVINGVFDHGALIDWDIPYNYDQEYSLSNYCQFPDRRFMNTILLGFQPAEDERLTNIHPPRMIPKGHYDVGDGFYDPKTKWVYSNTGYYNKNGIRPLYTPVRNVNQSSKPFEGILKEMPYVSMYRGEDFIIEHCRKEWDEPTGYKPQLYEIWMTGRRKEYERLRKKLYIVDENKKSDCLKVLERIRSEIVKETNDTENDKVI